LLDTPHAPYIPYLVPPGKTSKKSEEVVSLLFNRGRAKRK